ncbi:MAG: thioredoxin domain-containing protein [Halobacteriovoraceae bacterium]|jgi:protein-disulfide isomerase|nr:thioredoxin domain-containing protein [Halobacteriovoraceae bacterium]
MKNKLIVIISSIVVLVGLFFIGSKLYKSSEKSRIIGLTSDNSKIFYPDYSPVYGNKDAKVIITEFLDPECESCRMFYPKVKELLKMYAGKVKLVVRYATFHQNSVHAIKVLEATRKQNKYWESLSLLFQYQPAWANHHNPQPLLVFSYLPEVGVDIERLKRDMQDPEIDKIIAQDMKDLKKLNVRGTPSFFVNGLPLENFGMGYLYEAVSKEIKKHYK